MDEEIERLVVSVRADVQGFASDVSAMGGLLEGPLAKGADRAGSMIETTLLRAVRTGKLGFEDLKRIALSAMAEIAQGAISSGIGACSAGVAVAGCWAMPGRSFRRRLACRDGLPAGPYRRGGPMWSASGGRSCSCRQRVGR